MHQSGPDCPNVPHDGSSVSRFPTPGDRFDGARGCEHTLNLMADGGLEPSRVITHRLPYERMSEAYEMAYKRDKSMLNVVFQWEG